MPLQPYNTLLLNCPPSPKAPFKDLCLQEGCFLFPKSARLLKSFEFRRFLKYRQQKTGTFIVLEIVFEKKNIHGARLGLTVSKKFGKAVIRNKIKRKIREAFRTCRFLLPKNLLINIRPRSHAIHAKAQEIQEEILTLLSINTTSIDDL